MTLQNEICSDLIYLQGLLIEAVAEALSVPPDQIKTTSSFDALGFDSLSKVGLVPQLETLCQCKLDPDVLFDYPNIEALAAFIAQLRASRSDTAMLEQTSTPRTRTT